MMDTMESVISLIKHPLTDTDHVRIMQAYEFARKYHEGQKRNSGEPYVEHVVAVARNCAELGMDVDGIYRKIREARSRGIPPPEETPAPAPVTKAEKKPLEEKPAEETTVASTPRKPVPAPKKKVKNATQS